MGIEMIGWLGNLLLLVTMSKQADSSRQQSSSSAGGQGVAAPAFKAPL